MNQKDAAQKLQHLLIKHFKVAPEQFDWEQPLEVLQTDFKILSYLVSLEQLIQQYFYVKVALVEKISTSFHTPKDVLVLINKQL